MHFVFDFSDKNNVKILVSLIIQNYLSLTFNFFKIYKLNIWSNTSTLYVIITNNNSNCKQKTID